MKPEPAPSVPGNTEAERMSNALRIVLTVPKEAILKAEAKLKEGKRRSGRSEHMYAASNTDGPCNGHVCTVG